MVLQQEGLGDGGRPDQGGAAGADLRQRGGSYGVKWIGLSGKVWTTSGWGRKGDKLNPFLKKESKLEQL